MPYVRPWERQVNEPGRAFHAFQIYRDMGFSRSLRRVAEALASEGEPVSDDGPQAAGGAQESALVVIVHPPGETMPDGGQGEVRFSSGRVKTWSQEWSWVERARAWDQEVDRYVREAQLNEIARMSRRQAQEARAAAAVVMAPIALFLKKSGTPDGAKRLESIPLEELLEFAVDASRNLLRIHEAERSAHCIRQRDMVNDEGKVRRQWEIFERAPDRPDPELSIESGREEDPL